MTEIPYLKWLFVDLDSYFASVEQQEHPELRDKPMAVVPMMAQSTCCLAASYEAKAYGIKTGTRVSDAQNMCPNIVFVEAHHELYVKYHHAVVAAVDTCMPVEAVLSIDEMAGRLYAHEQTPEEAKKLAMKIKAALAKHVGAYVKCSIGIAPNRFLAKVASDMGKPNGLTVIECHQLPQILHSLDLRDLPGIGHRMEKRLHQHGITSMEQLCSLDDRTMHTVWGGIGGDRFAGWLRGEDIELPPTKHTSLGHSHVLEPESRTTQGAYLVAKKLLAKAAVRLRKMGYWTGGLGIAVRFLKEDGWQGYQKLFDVQDTSTLLGHLDKMWKTIPRHRPIWVGVTLAPLVPPTQHTLSLFNDDRRERLSHAMDAINNKYGKNTAILANLFDISKKSNTKIAFNHVPTLTDFEDD